MSCKNKKNFFFYSFIENGCLFCSRTLLDIHTQAQLAQQFSKCNVAQKLRVIELYV